MLGDIRKLVHGSSVQVGRSEDGENNVGVEEHVVVDNRLAGNSFPDSKGRNAKHGVSTLGDFKLTQGFATVSVITKERIKVEWIKVVIPSDTFTPDLGHVVHVLATNGRVVRPTKGRGSLKSSNGSKHTQNSNQANGVEAVQDGRRTAVLEHKVGCNHFGEGPSDNRQHGETSMASLAFLHVVKIEFLTQAKGIESKITSVRTVEIGRTGQEGKGDGVVNALESATVGAKLDEVEMWRWTDMV